MEALQHLKAELAKATSPAVMVLASPAVDAACAKNGLSLAELLRPCGILRQLNGTVGGGLAGMFEWQQVPDQWHAAMDAGLCCFPCVLHCSSHFASHSPPRSAGAHASGAPAAPAQLAPALLRSCHHVPAQR